MSTEPNPTPAAPPSASSGGDGLNSLATKMFSSAPTEGGAAPSTAKFEMQPMDPGAKPAATSAPEPGAVAPAEPKEKKTVSLHDKITEKNATAAAKEAPAPDTDPFAHISPEKDMSEKSLTGWKALKTEATAKLRAAEQELANAKSQIETFRKATPAEAAEVERLKKEHQAALDRLAVLDVQNHPDFTRQYSEPKKKALAEATEVLGYNGKESVDLAVLMSKSPKDFAAAVSEITKDMNQMDATTVQTSLRSAYRIGSEERVALSKSGELQQQIAQREAQRAKAAFEETWKGLDLKDGLFPAVEIPDGADENEKTEIQRMNQAFANVRTQAENYAFGKLDERGVAQIAQKAALLDVHMNTVIPRMNTEYQKVRAERDLAIKELKAIRAGKNPGSFTGDSGKSTAPNGKVSLDSLATQYFTQQV